MTIPYPRALAAITSNSGRQMLACFEGLPPNEVVELATFIGDIRLAAIRRLSIGASTAQELTARTPPMCRVRDASLVELLAETSFQAFRDTVSCLDRGTEPGMVAHLVTAGIADVARRRDLAPLLTIPEDPTNTLPRTPTSVPRALNDADYAASARRLNVDVPAIKAVATVESSGRGFDGRGRPKILFEAHHFGPLTGQKFNRTHPHLSCPNTTKARLKAKKYYRWDQYERIMEAIILSPEPALQAASWGKFQVLGETHDGWPNVRSFVAAMYVSEENHLKAFEAFCENKGIVGALRRHDWTTFARGYNGRGQVGYDTDMAAAYRANGGH